MKRKKTNREGNLHRGPEDTMEAPRAIKRRRSREEPAERRRKDRHRKRRKRGQTADAPAVDGSSTDSEVDGNTEENPRNLHAEAYLFGEASTTAGGPGGRGAQGGVGEGPQQGFREETTSETAASLPTEQDEEESNCQEQGAAQDMGNNDERFPGGNPGASLGNPYDQENQSSAESETAGGHGDDGGDLGEEEQGRGNPDNSVHRNAEDHRNIGGADDGGTIHEAGRQGENQRNPPGFYENYFNPTERLAMALAGVRGSSEISDSAINKMLKVALEHREALESVGRGRNVKKLYTQKLRPKALRHIPRVFSAILLEEKVQGGLAYRRLEDLGGIPKQYLNLPNQGKTRIIREESYVKLRDIKEHHRKVHRGRGMSEEDLRNHFENAAISVDGVEEGNKCKTTFHVVTLRLGSCIYLYKIFNPLVGHRVASPSVQEVLG